MSDTLLKVRGLEIDGRSDETWMPIVNGINFDGVELVSASASTKRNLLGRRIAYVAQSAAASFNPAHRLIDQHNEAPVQYRLKKRMEAQEDAVELYRRLRL